MILVFTQVIIKNRTTTNTTHTHTLKKKHSENKQNEMENNQDLEFVGDYDASYTLQIQFDIADTNTHSPSDGYKLRMTAF